jgi:hypothetical protein
LATRFFHPRAIRAGTRFRTPCFDYAQHALSEVEGRKNTDPACAVFFVNRDGLLQTGPGANGARVDSAVTG